MLIPRPSSTFRLALSFALIGTSLVVLEGLANSGIPPQLDKVVNNKKITKKLKNFLKLQSKIIIFELKNIEMLYSLIYAYSTPVFGCCNYITKEKKRLITGNNQTLSEKLL